MYLKDASLRHSLLFFEIYGLEITQTFDLFGGFVFLVDFESSHSHTWSTLRSNALRHPLKSTLKIYI